MEVEILNTLSKYYILVNSAQVFHALLYPPPIHLNSKTCRTDTEFFNAFVLHFHSNKTLLPYINE